MSLEDGRHVGRIAGRARRLCGHKPEGELLVNGTAPGPGEILYPTYPSDNNLSLSCAGGLPSFLGIAAPGQSDSYRELRRRIYR
ncbi:MAG: hypothetical protein V8T45_04840 [Oscillospiraceae bacterium]